MYQQRYARQGTYNNVLLKLFLGYNQLSPSHTSSSSTSTDETAQQLAAKEMYRSKSLPLNASLPQLPQKDSPFVVPKYQAKPNRFRSRSNSLIAKQQQQQQQANITSATMQSAISEPVLSSLAQLLTTNSKYLLLFCIYSNYIFTKSFFQIRQYNDESTEFLLEPRIVVRP